MEGFNSIYAKGEREYKSSSFPNLSISAFKFYI